MVFAFISFKQISQCGQILSLLLYDRMNFFHQFIHQLFLRHFSQNLAMAKNHTNTVTARNADVRLARFAGAIDNAAHHGNLQLGVQSGNAAFHFIGDANQINLGAAAGRARYNVYTRVVETDSFQNRICRRDFVHRICGQRDANCVADAQRQQDLLQDRDSRPSQAST